MNRAGAGVLVHLTKASTPHAPERFCKTFQLRFVSMGTCDRRARDRAVCDCYLCDTTQPWKLEKLIIFIQRKIWIIKIFMLRSEWRGAETARAIHVLDKSLRGWLRSRITSAPIQACDISLGRNCWSDLGFKSYKCEGWRWSRISWNQIEVLGIRLICNSIIFLS